MWDNELAAAAAANDNPIPADIQQNISSLLQSTRGGITVMDFGHRYTEKYGIKLKWQDYGFRSFTDLLKAVPGVNVVRDNKSDTDRIFLREYEPATLLTGSQQTTKLSSVLKNKNKNEPRVPLAQAALPRDQRYPARSMNADSDNIDNEKDREIRMRQKPLHSRFRNDDKWELHVRNFPYDTTEEDLLEAFKIVGCNKVRLKNPDDKPPFAFITFNDYEQAAEAFVTMDGSNFNGRRLHVAFSRSSIVLDEAFLQRQEARQFPVEVTCGGQSGQQFPVQSMNRGNRAASQFPVDVTVGHRRGGDNTQASTDSKTAGGRQSAENRQPAVNQPSSGQKPAYSYASKLSNQSSPQRTSVGQHSPERTNASTMSTDRSARVDSRGVTIGSGTGVGARGDSSGVTIGSGTGVGASVNGSDSSGGTAQDDVGDRFDDDVRRRNADRLERLGSKNLPNKPATQNRVKMKTERVDRLANNSVADRKFEAMDTEIKTVARRTSSPEEEETVPKCPVENESDAKHRMWFTEHGNTQLKKFKEPRQLSSDSSRPLALVSPQKLAAFSSAESRQFRSSNTVKMPDVSNETELKQLLTAESETGIKTMQNVSKNVEDDGGQIDDSWLESLRSHRHLLSDPVEGAAEMQQNGKGTDAKPQSDVEAAAQQTNVARCCEHESDQTSVKHFETDLNSTDETLLKCASDCEVGIKLSSLLEEQVDAGSQNVLDNQNLLEWTSSTSSLSDSVKEVESRTMPADCPSSTESKASLPLLSDDKPSHKCETVKSTENVAEDTSEMKVSEKSETGMVPERVEACCGKETDDVVNSLIAEVDETVPQNTEEHFEDEKKIVRSKPSPKLPSLLAKKLLNSAQVYSRSGFTVWTNVYSRDSSNLGEIRLEFPESVDHLTDKQRTKMLTDFHKNCTVKKLSTITTPAGTVLSADTSSNTSGNMPSSSDCVVERKPISVPNDNSEQKSIQVVTQTVSAAECKQQRDNPANVVQVDELPPAARKNSDRSKANGIIVPAAKRPVFPMATKPVALKPVKSVQPVKTKESTPQEMMTGSLVHMHRQTCPHFLPFVADDLPETLDILITFVSDKQHFWAQVVNEGEHLDSVQQMLDLMEQLMAKNKSLPIFCSRDELRAVAVYDGELARVWIKSLGEVTSRVFYIDYGNTELVKTFNLFVPPNACWDVRPAATPFRYVGPQKNLESLVNTRCTAKRVCCDSLSDQHIIVVDSLNTVDVNE